MNIKANLEGDWIRLNFHFDRDIIGQIKEIPGRKFDAKTKIWSIPAPQWRTFIRWFSKQGVDVETSPEQEEELRKLEKFSFTPVKTIKGLIGKLYPFQEDGVGFLVERRRGLLADDMGLGKTIMAIAAAVVLRDRGVVKKVLVFAPKSVVPQWEVEFENFFGEETASIAGTKADREGGYLNAEKTFLVVTNYETVLREHDRLLELKPDLIILDEAQRIGSYEAKTTKKIMEYFRTPYRWALTGTPLENSLDELHSIFSWIDPGILGPWWGFKNTYLVYGGFRGKQIVGNRNLGMLRDQISDWMLRRMKDDVLKELPPLTVNNYFISLSDEERAIYKSIREDLHKAFIRWKQTGEDSGEMLAKLTYLRECCDHPALLERSLGITFDGDSSKLEELIDILNDLRGKKIVLFSEFERMHQLIMPKIDVGYARLHGQMNMAERIRNITRFREDPSCKILMSTEAGEHGLNLQVASHIINFELHWNPARLSQRVDRLRRIGQVNETVTCINLIVKNSIEERVLEVIRDKTSLFRKVIDGNFEDISEGSLMAQILSAEFAPTQKRLF